MMINYWDWQGLGREELDRFRDRFVLRVEVGEDLPGLGVL